MFYTVVDLHLGNLHKLSVHPIFVIEKIFNILSLSSRKVISTNNDVLLLRNLYNG